MESVQSRHELLRHLGVGQWYSKYTLVSSPPTPIKLLSVSAFDCDEVSDSHAESYVDPQAGQRSLDVVMTDLVVSPPDSKSLPQKAQDVPQESLSVVSLSLVMVKIEDLLICYESSGDESGSFNSEQSLLLAIVKSIHPDVVSFEDAVGSSFVWPPFLSSSLLNDQSVYFESNLKRWFGSQDLNNIAQVLYFGSSFNSVESIILELRAEIESGFVVQPLAFSLSELLAAPVKKKSLWLLLSKVGVLGG